MPALAAMETSLPFKNAEEIEKAISLIDTAKPNASLKERLLRCYLLNLLLSSQVDSNHPVKTLLIKLSVYIELVDKATHAVAPAGSNILKEHKAPETSDLNEEDLEDGTQTLDRRPINYVMAKNKTHTDRTGRKKQEQGNPRIKNKRRFQDAHDLAKKVRDTHHASKL
ncbi:hypothetical protein NEDG_01187 [Nematocida displodere]|uniref:Uncharacterized protein n=1 Tax=Nematocida displodere TaxID=1805483 RepID=A0A177EB61_9MICR|nr:hypothetical protein NEDG_01187 [Nematocida displodere]